METQNGKKTKSVSGKKINYKEWRMSRIISVHVSGIMKILM